MTPITPTLRASGPIALVVAALIFMPGVIGTAIAQGSNSTETYRLLNLFGDVFERIRAKYVEEVEDKALIESAINGMLSSLDPHSGYLDSKSFDDMRVQTKGEFGGLGIEVTMEDGLVKVVSPIDDTPAARAGLESGDLITHLDGNSILGLTLNQAVKRMRGPVSSRIILTVRREGMAPFDVTIERAIIKIQSVRHEAIDDIGYVRITTFNEQTMPGLEKSIQTLQEEIGDDFAGIVLDLRNNPGGLLVQATAVSDAFLEQGEIVSTQGRNPENTSRAHATPGDLISGLPMVVLINGGSASASEIVAGALQDHRRAIVIGTKSFGKGSVQTIIPLDTDVAMRLTTARYFTPSGRSIQQTGINPDIEVPAARIEMLGSNRPERREADLRNALDGEADDEEADAAAQQPAPTGRPSVAEQAEQDYQLARALDLLRSLQLYNARQ